MSSSLCWRPALLLAATLTLALLFAFAHAEPSARARAAAQQQARDAAHRAAVASRSAGSKADELIAERAANLQLALAELNRLAALPWAGAPASHPSAPPRWALHRDHAFSESAVDTRGELATRVPVYRTVRGFDEKRGRPVVYQTLVHEERMAVARVDRSVTYHLALRQVSAEETRRQAAAREAAAQQQAHPRECAAASADDAPAGECLAPLPAPQADQLLHAVLTVGTDKDGARALTSLRSADAAELRKWWDAFLASEHEEAAGRAGAESDSAAFARMRDAHLQLQEGYWRTIHARLQGQPPWASPDRPQHTESAARPSHWALPVRTVGQLRVMSVNIWNFNYWSRRQALLQAVIREQAPDLIGFQEVRAYKAAPTRPGGGLPLGATPPPAERWQVADLARLLPGYEYAYEAAMGFREGGGEFVHEGLALFSAWPMGAPSALRLSRDAQDGQDFHQRMCLHARVRTPWGALHLLTTHLSLSMGARLRTLPEVARVAAALLPEPSVLVGDFNAPFGEGPDALTYAPFRFRDAWQAVHGPDHAADDAARLRAQTFHSWDHRSRIDFIFYNSRDPPAQAAASAQAHLSPGPGHLTQPLLVARAIEVVGSAGVSLRGEPLPPIGGVADMRDTMFPSDHMFLAATFEVRPLPATREEEERRREEAARAAAETQGAKARKPKPDPSKRQPLTAGIGLKDEL